MFLGEYNGKRFQSTLSYCHVKILTAPSFIVIVGVTYFISIYRFTAICILLYVIHFMLYCMVITAMCNPSIKRARSQSISLIHINKRVYTINIYKRERWHEENFQLYTYSTVVTAFMRQLIAPFTRLLRIRPLVTQRYSIKPSKFKFIIAFSCLI